MTDKEPGIDTRVDRRSGSVSGYTGPGITAGEGYAPYPAKPFTYVIRFKIMQPGTKTPLAVAKQFHALAVENQEYVGYRLGTDGKSSVAVWSAPLNSVLDWNLVNCEADVYNGPWLDE